MENFYQLEAKKIDGSVQKMSEYEGKTVLVVNVASKCGLTNQYKGLEELYLKYKDQGLVILGFPCNQFGSQEPGTETEIKEFCSLNYNVTFPLFAKVDVNGPATHPLFSFLKKAAKTPMGNEDIKWNFNKFLISKQGKVLTRFSPTITPESLISDLSEALKA